MRSDWIVTTRQALPDFFRLVRRLRPTASRDDIRALDPDCLREAGVEAILWDVDGTLMSHHAREVAGELRSAWERLRSLPGTRHAIVSNCGEDRYRDLGEIFPAVPVFKAYREGTSMLLRRLYQHQETWNGAPRPAGAHGLRPVKKPSGEYLDGVLASLGNVPRGRAVMIGDQYFTDIAGANLASIRSIKVRTWDRASFPLPLRIFQRIEAVLYRLVPQEPGLAADGDFLTCPPAPASTERP